MELLLTIVYLLICIGLITLVLLQSGKSAGLGTIAGGVETLFGKKKGIDDKLARYTQIVAMTFLAMSIVMIVFLR
ncbi:MAG TPA: preprotein translocase subunit SecG [Thermoanaerobacterales bacterium]|uniref:preprotein translocase subunit SecG n=1 Tax=Tepidanaerobacter sp. GT38 TaxID=2722793 RepID=UPI0017BEFFC7|nr:preprotein translocase subunit SecG [Tepidanaerobacter sp. GT38]MCG1011279.1 preprotein translocase subunit SecG [Tepidanaerobacter sp. GT38]HHY43086.1 preprotein translocase subunit SecG [Thermoanaerobacterales bacterium]